MASACSEISCVFLIPTSRFEGQTIRPNGHEKLIIPNQQWTDFWQSDQSWTQPAGSHAKQLIGSYLPNSPFPTGDDKLIAEFPLKLTSWEKKGIQTILAVLRSAGKLLQLSACIESKPDRGNKDVSPLLRLLTKSPLFSCLKEYYGSVYKAFACKVILSKCLRYCWLPTGGLTTQGKGECNPSHRESWCSFTMKWSSLNSPDTDAS